MKRLKKCQCCNKLMEESQEYIKIKKKYIIVLDEREGPWSALGSAYICEECFSFIKEYIRNKKNN